MDRYYDQQLIELAQRGELRTLRQLSHEGKNIVLDGLPYLNLSGNDYLGIGADKSLRKEFLSEMLDSTASLGSCSSRLLTGNDSEYDLLEEALSKAYNKESALLFNSGYHANIGIVGALSDKGTLVLSDKLVHASVIDGLRLSEATSLRFRHNDLNHLELLLKRHSDRFQRIIVITESLFSMDGDCADLIGLVQLRNRFSFMLYVDEAHAVGVRGRGGLGLSEELGVLSEIDLLVGTFGKAYSSMGAFLLCGSSVREMLVNRCRPLIFSTAMPPLTVAWSRFIFNRMGSFIDRRAHLAAISKRLGSVVGSSSSHIIPMILGDNDRTIRASELLQREGFFVLPIRPPTVPLGTSRLRFSLSSSLSLEEMERLIMVIESIQ